MLNDARQMYHRTVLDKSITGQMYYRTFSDDLQNMLQSNSKTLEHGH